jgi:hypothetical protein
MGVREEGLKIRGLVGGEDMLHEGRDVGAFRDGMLEVAWEGAWALVCGTLGVHVEIACSLMEGGGADGLGICRKLKA